MSSNSRLKESIITHNNKKKFKKRKCWPIVMILMLIVVTALVAIMATIYSSVKKSYYQNVYTSGFAPKDSEDTSYNLAILYHYNSYNDGLQEETVNWFQILKIDTKEEQITRYLIPKTAIFNNEGAQYSLASFAQVGIEGIIDDIENFLNITVHYGAIVRLDYLRDVLDQLPMIEYHPEELKKLNMIDKTNDYLSSLYISNLMNKLKDKKDLQSLYQQQLIIDNLFNNIFKLSNLLKIDNFMNSSNLFLETNLKLELILGILLEKYTFEDINMLEENILFFDQDSQNYHLNVETFQKSFK